MVNSLEGLYSLPCICADFPVRRLAAAVSLRPIPKRLG